MDKNTDVGVLLKNISDAIESTANQELLPFGLTVSQYRYLEYIQKFPEGVSARDIGAYFKVSQPTVAGILKRLRAKCYIRSEVTKEDERAKLLYITPEGIAITRQAAAHKASTEERILCSLTPEERATVKALLTKIYGNFYGTPEGGVSE